MLSFLPASVKCVLSFSGMVINTFFWASFLFPITFLKLIIPIKGWRKLCGKVLIFIATNWISVNNLNLALINNIEWDVTGLDNLEMDDWYLVLANHQSWADILVLQKIFNRKIPFLKFFLKKELIWVPIMGQAWWALDYPFMKRYTKEYLEKHPEMKGKDLETTKEACEKFKELPISVMNFVEGTRLKKHIYEKQNPPYKNLLKPKAAGIAYVLAAMGDQMNSILDVTIAYPKGTQEFFGFLAGKSNVVRVSIKKTPVSPEILGDYFNDDEFRKKFQDWLNGVWEKKDLEMDRLLKLNN